MTRRAADAPSLGGVTLAERTLDERGDDTIVAEDSVDPEDDGVLAPGQLVDSYEVMRLLRQGGMGEIYVARDVNLGRRVALKLVHRKLIGSEEAKERFLEEARTTARFSHPHIVTVHSVGEHAGRPYVALEYLEGDNLRERIHERRPKLPAALRIGLAVAEVLAEAHHSGILHLDLKPENVMIPRDGRVRVVDFGLATRSLDAYGGVGGDRVDEDGAPLVWGTPRFMAPEQWTSEPLSGAADVWALGMILYELASGRLPYGRLTTRAELYHAVRSAEPVPSVRRQADLPETLVTLIEACVDKDAKARPTAADVADALREMLFGNWTRPTDEEGPFRGLLPFTERHADLYFGRDEEIAAFVERARLVPVLPVVGPSGAGKSSFIRAGVFQRLREEEPWLFIKLTPGPRPFDALAARLYAAQYSQGTIPPPPASVSSPSSLEGLEPIDRADALRLADELVETPRRLSLELRQLAERQRRKVLLFVDQTEELFTLVEDDDVRRAFISAICTAADDAQDPVRVVFCIRDDYLGRLATDPEVAQALAQITVIQSLGREALEEIMVRPVDAVGYGYDDPRMPAEMVDAVGGEPGCLPLLQFAGRRLWEERDKVARLLLREVYDEMGGVEGALASHADGVLAALSPEQLDVARALLLRLVTAERARRRRSKGEALEGIGAEAEQVLARLTDARLVVVTKRSADNDDDSGASLELAHESLIWAWGTLARWLDETREERGFLAEVGQAADLWDKRGRRPEELWRGLALADALRARSRCSTAMPGKVAAFLEQAELREQGRLRRKRRIIGTAIGSSVLVAVVAVAMALAIADKEREAVAQRDRALAERAATLRESSRGALAQGHLLEARAKLRLALELEDDPDARALWWQISQHPLVWRRELSDRVFAVDFSPDGKVIAAGCHDEAIYLFDTLTGATRVLHGNGDQVLGLRFLPSGQQLVTSSYNGEVRLWDVASGQPTRLLAGSEGRTYEVAVSPDGALVGAGDEAGSVRVWRTSDAELVHTFAAGEGKIESVAFHPNGTRLASAGADGKVRIWDLGAAEQVQAWGSFEGGATAVVYDPTGKTLAAAGANGELLLRDTEGGATRPMLGQDVAVDALRFTRDGKRLVAAGYDGRVRIWDVPRGALAGGYGGHDKHVSSVAVSADGSRVVSASWDHSVHLWRTDIASGGATPVESSGSRSISFAPDGKRLVSAHYDGTLRFWDTLSGDRQGVVRAHRAALYDVAFSPDGATVASSSDDLTVRLWDATTLKQRRVLAGHRRGVTGLSFHPDGATLASASKDGSVMRWDLASGVPSMTLRGSGSELFDVAFTGDGSTLVASGGPALRVWDAETGEHLRDLVGPRSNLFGLAIRPDDRVVVAGGAAGAVWRWDLDDEQGRVLGRHPERIYWLTFRAGGEMVGAPGSDGTARLWTLADETHRELNGHRDEVNNVEFSPDGRFAATAADDGTVRLWDADSGRPHWRAPVLVPRPPRLLSHKGWATLDGSDAAAPRGKWVARIEAEARRAEVEGALACLVLHDGSLEAWDRERDERLGQAPGPFERGVVVGDRCVGHGLHGVAMLGRDGFMRALLREAASAIATDGDDLLVAVGAAVARFDAAGKELARRPTGGGLSALVALDGGVVALGYRDGNLELVAPQAAPLASFQGVPSAAPERMVAGPAGTLIVGYANGLVGMWSLRDGKRLAEGRLHGRVVHLHLEGRRLDAATDLGDHLSWDLDAFHRGYCELLDRVWSWAPVVWEGGEPKPRPPPAAHACR